MVHTITKTALFSFVAAIRLSSGEGTGVSTYDFPTTDFEKYSMGDNAHMVGGMFHGLCVLGAKHVSTEIRSPPGSFNFGYTSMPWVEGVEAWANSGVTVTGIKGNGPEVCEGGTYLQPSEAKGPPEQGTNITLKATPENELQGVTICALFSKPFDWFGTVIDPTGNWVDPLMQDGFTLSEKTVKIGNNPLREMNIYCKLFEPATGCPGDIRLKETCGDKAFPASAVTILSRDTDTVTVALNQAWDATVDKYFYSFHESMFSNHCYEEEGFAPGQSLPPITIQCLVTSPLASVRICLQDTGGGLLSNADDAIISKCCESDAPENTPTVCYNLDIMCETTCVPGEKSRMLRGRI